MNPMTNPSWEEHLGELARQFAYPVCPDVALAVRQRLASERKHSRPHYRWAAVLITLAVVLTALFSVPGVRAQLAGFFRIGAVSILPATPAPIPLPMTSTPAGAPPAAPTSAYSTSLLDIAGETTLAEAKSKAAFLVRLPTYPPDLGQPERVYLKDDGAMVILVWLDPKDPQQGRLSLHEIEPGATTIQKYQPPVIQETQVNGQFAIWTEGPYLLQLTNGNYDLFRLVEGHTLVWTEGKITYRLETESSLEEALKIAESLK